MNHAAHSASPEPPESSAGSPGWARKYVRGLELRVRDLEIALRATEAIAAELADALAISAAALAATRRELAEALRCEAAVRRELAAAKREALGWMGEAGRLKGRLAEREGWGVRPGHYLASGGGNDGEDAS